MKLIFSGSLVFLLVPLLLSGCREGEKTTSSSGTEIPRTLTEEDKQRLYFYNLANKAAEGDIESLRELGTRYILGQGLLKSPEKGLPLLTKAAEGGSAKAQYALAQIYYAGELAKQNTEQALLYMTRAADAGVPDAQRDLATWYMEGSLITQNWERAKHYLEMASANHDADAQYILGEMYLSGTGVAQDEAKARECFQKAALQAHPRAKQRVEFLLKRDEEKKKDPQ